MKTNKLLTISVLSLTILLLFSCEGLATLFHGEKPEEETPPPPTYTITFDANGAVGSVPTAQTVDEDSIIILPNETGLTFSGKVFIGWCVSPSGTGTTYTVGYSFSVTANQTLYARWSNAGDIQQYTVTFNANGSTSGTPPVSQTVYDGISIIIPNQGTLTNTGFIFSGWNTSSNGAGISYAIGNSLVVSANIMLYAEWVIDPNVVIPPGLYEGTPLDAAHKIGNQTLDEAIAYISLNNNDGDAYTVVLGTNESTYSLNLDYSGNSVSITLMGSGATRIVNLDADATLFTVGKGATLILGNEITLKGRSTNTNRLVKISGGTLIMNDGSKIISNSGGGVSVDENDVIPKVAGTFTMNGGEISSNTILFNYNDATNSYTAGVGVYVGRATFRMNGGKISNNTGNRMGGGVCLNHTNAQFIMVDGKINSNTLTSSWPWGAGGGVLQQLGNFTLSGGEISGNTAVSGGGIYNVYGTLIMDGGVISSNIAGDGGGVLISGGATFSKLSTGGIIYGLNASPTSLSNMADNNDSGHAVKVSVVQGIGKKRNNTVRSIDALDSATNAGWE
jgi:hypothetical protein